MLLIQYLQFVDSLMEIRIGWISRFGN